MERTKQTIYWKTHCVEPSFEAMMLDTRAEELDQSERPEILSNLGPVTNKRVLELGSGIGRFTGELAKEAKSVIANDFMENLVVANQKSNGHFGNITFSTEDATTLEYDTETIDVVFSNWLLMYLSEEEIEKTLSKALGWLTTGGVLFFRESCYQQSGDIRREENPTHYRDISTYFSIIDRIFWDREDGKRYRFRLMRCANLLSYAKAKKNYGQIFWKFVKVQEQEDIVDTRCFLDSKQYTKNGILRYERVFGSGFISTGGIEIIQELVQRLHLKPGESVIDFGCGIGGGDVYLAKEFGAEVLGIDLSVNAVTIALERLISGKYSLPQGIVTFEISDITKRELEKESVDVVYSRDALLHIHDKPALFRSILDSLKPGGRILITDYCCSEGIPTEGFAAYIKQRNYDLHSPKAYGKMLEDAGFIQVDAIDATESLFLPCLLGEVKAMELGKGAFLNEFTEHDYLAVVNGWSDKIARVQSGEQRWGVFYAKKADQS